VNTFGKLQAYHRMGKNISRAELAAHIEKDPSYIRRIEIENYVPPFQTCERIATKLGLSVSEKRDWYQIGFEKRISVDMGFYRLLHAGDDRSPTDTALRSDADGQCLSRCVYAITWQTKGNLAILDTFMVRDLDAFLRRTIQALGLCCYEIHILPQQVDLVIEISPNYSPHVFVTNLQTSAAGFLCTKFPNLDAPADIWDTVVFVQTLGERGALHVEPSEASTQMLLKSPFKS
jgi:REP element-mobilizing transposase RayT/DNA-binding XRE family transcriptional regulator